MKDDKIKEMRVLVTPTSYGKNDPRLKSELEELVGEVIYNPAGKPLKAEEVAGLLPGVDGYIAGLDTINRFALQAADRLKVIARYGVGVDAVDLAAARERGIVVTNTPGANSASVAELALGCMLALARQIPAAIQATQQGHWPRLSGISLQGKTVGILGLGAIGKQLVQRLAGFDCQVIAYDPFPDRDFVSQHGVKLTAMESVVAEADFLSLHLPLLPETRGMVNRNFLGNMKAGAFLVNTSRGEVIDESALYEALVSGHLAGAALDTFSQEPPDPNHPLLHHPAVIATPHIGAQTDGATNQMGWMALKDCLAVLRGQEPRHRVV
jgi:D-3-phosphoglycerate dehydrogenase